MGKQTANPMGTANRRNHFPLNFHLCTLAGPAGASAREISYKAHQQRASEGLTADGHFFTWQASLHHTLLLLLLLH